MDSTSMLQQLRYDKQSAIYGDSLEFYHDKVFDDLKTRILGRKNICGKVTRELVKGSIVYPIKDYGAVEIGLYKFHNNQEPAGTPSKASKFIISIKK
jgi:hypothetical protein